MKRAPPEHPGHNNTLIDNPAVEPLRDYSLEHLVIQVDLSNVPWLAALSEGKDDAYVYLSDFFAGVTFGLMLGRAYEVTLIFQPQPGKYHAFATHVDTPPNDMNMQRAALRIEDMKPIEVSQSEWLLLPKIEAPRVTFAPVGQEWSSELAQWYRNFGVPGTPGAAAGSDGEDLGTFTPIPVSSPARTFLEQVDTVLDVLQTAREKRARELRRKATVASTELECPGCHHRMEPPQRACPNCGKPLGSGFQNPGAATQATLELGPGQADRFNSFQKLQVITPYGEIEAPFEVMDRNRLRVSFKRPAVLPDNVEVSPIEGGAVAAAQRHALDMALSGHPDLATVVQLVAEPEKIPQPRDDALPNPLFNEMIEDNLEQQEAVRRVVAMPQGSVMMLQGPPGTGKTTVIVEAVRQILEAQPHARILISSHSNRAVDDATERLQKVGVKIFRLRAGDDVGVGTWDRAGDERVVAATCNKAVVTEGQRGEQYTYAFLDEANKARAEETLPFIALGERVVLIGDHHQLPPVVEEEDLGELRRGTPEWHLARSSYFEILWGSTLPETNKTVFLVQHRMHPAIRHLVSQRFYRGQLRDGEVVKKYQRPKIMGAPRSLIWIDSAGAEVREMRTGNGSIYNLNHVNICRGLVRMVSERTDPSLNIALIGMYREQLRRYGGWKQWTNRDFRADTVDAFEGAEADIVIVDLVRSNPRGMVGFLEVHNRINVAMSRAKRLLIIVGDSQTVRSNRVLRQVLEGFRRSGAIIPWNRLPHVAKGQKRRRRRTRQPREGQARVVSITPTEENGGGGDSGADATPRRLPRLRDWTPGEALPDAAENGAAGEADAVAGSDTRPRTGDMDPPRRSRRRRRRRRRRGAMPGDTTAASDGGQTTNVEHPSMPTESSPAERVAPPREPSGDPPAPAEG
ncbi:MAG: AAA domain-containing protein [Candidatus Dormiibacterota bacterium]